MGNSKVIARTIMDRLKHAIEACEKSRINRKPINHKTIYLISCENYYKIGYASNLYQRMCQYRVHNPLDVSVVFHAETRAFKLYEHWIHKHFAHKHKHGEWYCLDSDDVNRIKIKWFL